MLSNVQHGFVENRSTATNQLVMLDTLTQQYDKKVQTDMILLDFSKAFDKVPHIKLIQILKAFKIHKDVVKWIESLLQTRTQQTVVDNHFSQKLKVISGVPQGSVLAPSLFNVYINGLLNKINDIEDVVVLAFADDVKLISHNHTKLQEALLVVDNWCKDFKLQLNVQKSIHLCFRPSKDQTYSINGQKIQTVERTKDLGIYLNNKLQWKDHTAQLKRKATSLCYVILRSFTRNHTIACLNAFKIYVRPLLEYNTEIWNTSNKGEIKCIEQVQRLFTRKLLQRNNVKYNDYNHRLEILHLQSLELRRLHFDLVTIYKITNNLINLNFEQFFELRNSNYSLRQHMLSFKKPPVPKTSTLKNSFKYRVIEAWNFLPNKLVTAKSLSIFKRGLQEVSLQNFVINHV